MHLNENMLWMHWSKSSDCRAFLFEMWRWKRRGIWLNWTETDRQVRWRVCPVWRRWPWRPTRWCWRGSCRNSRRPDWTCSTSAWTRWFRPNLNSSRAARAGTRSSWCGPEFQRRLFINGSLVFRSKRQSTCTPYSPIVFVGNEPISLGSFFLPTTQCRQSPRWFEWILNRVTSEVRANRNGFFFCSCSDQVMLGIEAAAAAGYRPKINCVVMRGLNDDELVDFVRLTERRDVEVRFIEYMPFQGNKWNDKKMVPYAEMVRLILQGVPSLEKVADAANDTSKVRVHLERKSTGFFPLFINPRSQHLSGLTLWYAMMLHYYYDSSTDNLCLLKL